MRVRRAALAAVALVALGVGSVSAATTLELRATVHMGFSHGQTPPCENRVPDDTTCVWVGRDVGLGPVSYDVTTTFTTDRYEIVLPGGTLQIAPDFEAATFVRPGNSTNAPGALVSFGNPSSATVPFEIVSGTGAYAGATGEGTQTWRIAGDIWVIKFQASVSVP